MNSSQVKEQGTCVIGELTNFSAFASIQHGATVWAKRYPDLQKAVDEARRLGVIDKLFASAAAKFIQQTRSHCVSPVAGKIDRKKLEAAGFRQAGMRAMRSMTEAPVD